MRLDLQPTEPLARDRAVEANGEGRTFQVPNEQQRMEACRPGPACLPAQLAGAVRARSMAAVKSDSSIRFS